MKMVYRLFYIFNMVFLGKGNYTRPLAPRLRSRSPNSHRFPQELNTGRTTYLFVTQLLVLQNRRSFPTHECSHIRKAFHDIAN